MPNIDLGDYEIDEDSNGDLVIKDTNDNNVFRWDKSNATWTFDNNPIQGVSSLDTGEIDIGKLIAALDANGYDITDSGTTVYDASTDTVGDGTTDADHSSVSTEQTRYSGLSDGQTSETSNALSSDSGTAESTMPTKSISTTPQQVFDGSVGTAPRIAILFVSGVDESNLTRVFCDRVVNANGSLSTTALGGREGPDGRTYDPGGRGTIDMSMASGTYSVTIRAIEFKPI